LPEEKLHRIVIVGGGAGGLELATRLGKTLGKKKKASITLVDCNRTHLWKPLLHQVAAGTLDSHADELEYMAQGNRHHFRFRLGYMDGLNRANQVIYLAPLLDEEGEVLLPRQTLSYDTLVFAIGSQSNDFGTPGVREHCIMLDTAQAAERFHQKLINNFIKAQVQPVGNGAGRFTVAIIGGGATGVELAAELHMTAEILSSYGFQHIHPERDLKIAICDAAPRVLAALPERLSKSVTEELRKIDIDIHCNEKVVEVQGNGVLMASGKFIPSALTVWAAGIKVADFLKEIDGLESNRINQLVVTRTLQTTCDADIFAIGDCAACTLDGKHNVPPRAQSAHQQANLLAQSLALRLKGKPLPEFVYRDYGSLVSLGEYTTIGSLMGGIAKGSVFVEGWFAKWMYWLLYKKHQVAVDGWFRTWLATWSETIARVKNPRIKLH
jgi:NADH dehydrogenase